MDIYKKLQSMNLTLPRPICAQGIYSPFVKFDSTLICTSGMGPNNEGLPHYEGKLGKDYTTQDGQEISKQVVLNILANLHRDLGDLNKIKRFVKLLAFVNSCDDYYDQPLVANGASSLLLEIFGDSAGLPVRSV